MAQNAGPDESARADEAYGRRWHYLQLILSYSPVKTGLAFLPMIAALTASSTTFSGLLTPGVGPRILVAFWVSAGIFAGAAVVCALVLRPGTLTHVVTEHSEAAAPVPA